MLYKNSIYLGISPIMWTNDIYTGMGNDNSFEQAVSEAALSGFTGIEIGNKTISDIEILQKIIYRRQISVAGQSIGLFAATQKYELIEPIFTNILKKLQKLQAKYIVVRELSHSIFFTKAAVFDSECHLNKNEWSLLCDNLNKLGRLSVGYGLKLCFHPHMCTAIKTAEEINQLMEHTDKQYVKLCFDTSHFISSDEDAGKTIEKFGKRISYVHLGDIRRDIIKECKNDKADFFTAIKRGCFTVPGDGSINFQEVFTALDKAGYSGWAIVEAEQNPEYANPFEYALRAYYYLQALLEMQFPKNKMGY